MINVFDGVFFWNEYSNIRSEKPTSIRSLKNGIRDRPNGNYTLKQRETKAPSTRSRNGQNRYGFDLSGFEVSP